MHPGNKIFIFIFYSSVFTLWNPASNMSELSTKLLFLWMDTKAHGHSIGRWHIDSNSNEKLSINIILDIFFLLIYLFFNHFGSLRFVPSGNATVSAFRLYRCSSKSLQLSFRWTLAFFRVLKLLLHTAYAISFYQLKHGHSDTPKGTKFRNFEFYRNLTGQKCSHVRRGWNKL